MVFSIPLEQLHMHMQRHFSVFLFSSPPPIIMCGIANTEGGIRKTEGELAQSSLVQSALPTGRLPWLKVCSVLLTFS